MRISDSKNNTPKVCFDKLKKYNEKLNNVVSFIEPKENSNDGLLKNVAVVLKDNVCTKGVLTTACSNILKNYIPVYNAEIVDRLVNNGAVIIGKCSMDELAMGGTNAFANIGPCKNPYDLNRISGGSSGGSAVAVSSGAVSFSIGSDTGDSIRKPASYNGIIGVKPSYGRISRYGVIPYASSLDHVGYFCTNVLDATTILKVLAGRDDRDMTSSSLPVEDYSKNLNSDIKGKKILLFKNVIDSITNKKIVEDFNTLVNKLKNRGAIIEEVTFDNSLMRCILPTYYVIANAEATANHANLTGILFGDRKDGKDTNEIMINSRSEGFGSLVKKRFVIGSYALKEDNQEKYLRKAQKIRRLIVNEIMSKLKDADGLLAPAASTIAPLLNDNHTNELNDEYLIAENHMVISNFAGLPSITLPMTYVDNLPVGVNLSCNPFKEQDMFNISKAIEEETGLENIVKEDF